MTAKLGQFWASLWVVVSALFGTSRQANRQCSTCTGCWCHQKFSGKSIWQRRNSMQGTKSILFKMRPPQISEMTEAKGADWDQKQGVVGMQGGSWSSTHHPESHCVTIVSYCKVMHYLRGSRWDNHHRSISAILPLPTRDSLPNIVSNAEEEEMPLSEMKEAVL
jgi:hypothetical protein